jgi:hypothetical protein
LTIAEVNEVLKRKHESERAAYLRAGLIAATIINVNRRKGAKMVKPSDFIRERPRDEDYMDATTAKKVMTQWAKQTNASFAKRKGVP